MKKLTVLLLCVLSLSLISCGGGSDPLSPSFSPTPGERSPIVSGSYKFENSTCANDGSKLEVMQNVSSVYLKGGFAYGQEPVLADYDSAGYVDSESQVHFTIKGSEETVTCVATLLDGVFSGTCTLGSGDICDFVFSRPVEASTSEPDNSSSGDDDNSVHVVVGMSSCVHAPTAACPIYNSCYNCSLQAFYREPPDGAESCVQDTFEKICWDKISEVPSTDPDISPYQFVPLCVLSRLMEKCDSAKSESVDFCDGSDPVVINDCDVHGYSMDCANFAVWDCQEKRLLPGENDEREPPKFPIINVGG